MKKKVVIIILISLVSLGGFFLMMSNNKKRYLDEYSNKVKGDIELLSKLVNKHQIKRHGVAKIQANYKGAHGENYPAHFQYNYELSDKLYFENEEYNFIEIHESFLNIIKYLSNLNRIDTRKYANLKVNFSALKLTYDVSYINEILGSNFKSVKVCIKMKGLIKKIDYIEIYVDDLIFNIKDGDIKVNYKGNDINIRLSNNAYYFNVADNLKMNVFTNNNYLFSIVLNNKVYTVELKDDGASIIFNNESAIYNSVKIDLDYEDITLNKNKIDSNFSDNPLIRYLSEADLTVLK